MWRIQVAEGFQWWSRTYLQRSPDPAEVDERQAIALDAAAYFEKKGDWEACSEALDAAEGPPMVLGRWSDVVELSTRRLQLPDLPPGERLDARYVLLWSYVALGEYERCLDSVRGLLASRGPADPLTHLVPALVWLSISATLSGEWSAMDEVQPLIAEAIDSMGSSANARTLGGIYYDLLFVGLAREDRATTEAAATVLRRVFDDERDAVDRSIISAMLQSDPSLIDFKGVIERGGDWRTHLVLLVCNEHGLVVPGAMIEYIRELRAQPSIPDAIPPSIEITEAIAARDPAALARAIDQAERHQLIPHAARVRVVLAEMLGDPAPLEGARPELERLQDQQFLRRLDEVAAALGAPAAQSDG